MELQYKISEIDVKFVNKYMY